MNQKTKITISAILVVTWMAIIFCFSSVPADESNRQSLEIVNKAVEKFEAKSNLDIISNNEEKIRIGQANLNEEDRYSQQKQIKNQNRTTNTSNNQTKQKETLILKLNRLLRKFAHASVYFILYILVLNLIYQIKGKYKLVYCIISIVVCFVYACTDEFHQLFVDGRAGLFSDVIIDTIGATISFIIVDAIHRIISLIHKKDKRLSNKKEKVDTKR